MIRIVGPTTRRTEEEGEMESTSRIREGETIEDAQPTTETSERGDYAGSRTLLVPKPDRRRTARA